MIKKIPLLIATGLCVLSVVGTFISNMTSPGDLQYLYSLDTLIGIIALVLIWISVLINEKIWIYLFLIALLVSFSNLIDFSNFKLTIGIGSLTINIIALVLTISHFALNGQTIKIKSKTEDEIIDEYENKVAFFLKKFSSKSKEELFTMQNHGLVPEAKEAIRRLTIE